MEMQRIFNELYLKDLTFYLKSFLVVQSIEDQIDFFQLRQPLKTLINSTWFERFR